MAFEKHPRDGIMADPFGNVKHLKLGEGCKVGKETEINCEYLTIGSRTVIGRGCKISGRRVTIGTECWFGDQIVIGGGSCFEVKSELKMGDFCHLGNGVFINTARKVSIGDEVGLGMETKIFTHGAYLSPLDGFPVKFAEIKIGSRVWIPQATVLPGVTIGDDCVIAAGSVVTHDVTSGCLAGGTPAKIIKESVYPSKNSEEEKKKILGAFLDEAKDLLLDHGFDFHVKETAHGFEINRISLTFSKEPQPNAETCFYLNEKKIIGQATELAELIKNELRRYGIRFRSFKNEKNRYEDW